MAPPECDEAWADEMERTEAEVAEAVRQHPIRSDARPSGPHVVLKEIYLFCAAIRAFLSESSGVPCLSASPEVSALWEYDGTFRSLRNLYMDSYLSHKGTFSHSDPARVFHSGSLSMLETVLVRDEDGTIIEKEMPMFVCLGPFGQRLRLSPNPTRALIFTTRVNFTGAVRHSHPKRGQVKLYNEDGSVDIVRHKRGAVYYDSYVSFDHPQANRRAATSTIGGRENYVAKYVCPRRNGS